MENHYQTIVCGAGVAGVSAAYYLAVRYGHSDLLIVDGRQPLSLTTAKSGENYRDYWPQSCMTDFASASIDLMTELIKEHGDVFDMRESGYLFVSREAGRDIFPVVSDDDSPGDRANDSQTFNRLLDRNEIRRRWPHLSHETEQVVSIPRAGTIDVQALGNLLLSEARRHDLNLRKGTVNSITRTPEGGFRLSIDERSVTADNVVLASGPFVAPMASSLGVELPLYNVVQRKFFVPDPRGVVPAGMPFTICADPVTLGFEDEESAALQEDPALRWLLEPLPAGLHIKPEPGGLIKIGWAFNRTREIDAQWEIANDPNFPNIAIRGAMQMLPGLETYVESLPTPVTQYGGYYTRTEENWPMIGPTQCPGLYVVAGLSGFGTMTACAVGDLLARHVVGDSLPSYARNFHPDRYSDPTVVLEINAMVSDGQL